MFVIEYESDEKYKKRWACIRRVTTKRTQISLGGKNSLVLLLLLLTSCGGFTIDIISSPHQCRLRLLKPYWNLCVCMSMCTSCVAWRLPCEAGWYEACPVMNRTGAWKCWFLYQQDYLCHIKPITLLYTLRYSSLLSSRKWPSDRPKCECNLLDPKATQKCAWKYLFPWKNSEFFESADSPESRPSNSDTGGFWVTDE